MLLAEHKQLSWQLEAVSTKPNLIRNRINSEKITALIKIMNDIKKDTKVATKRISKLDEKVGHFDFKNPRNILPMISTSEMFCMTKNPHWNWINARDLKKMLNHSSVFKHKECGYLHVSRAKCLAVFMRESMWILRMQSLRTFYQHCWCINA